MTDQSRTEAFHATSFRQEQNADCIEQPDALCARAPEPLDAKRGNRN